MYVTTTMDTVSAMVAKEDCVVSTSTEMLPTEVFCRLAAEMNVCTKLLLEVEFRAEVNSVANAETMLVE